MIANGRKPNFELQTVTNSADGYKMTDTIFFLAGNNF